MSNVKGFDKKSITLCYHCGEDCLDESLVFEAKHFCCPGCKLVYEVLKENDLAGYYTYADTPGTKAKKNNSSGNEFDYLDEEAVIQKLVDFKNEKETHITLNVPAIHCASCVWLLENLHRLDGHIYSSRTDFVKKECHLKFLHEGTSLKDVIKLLDKIGYRPTIQLADIQEKKRRNGVDKRLVYQLAVAGFCFGNMMFFSLPGYFSEVSLLEEQFRGVFAYLNLALSLPIVLYAATDFYRSAWFAIKSGRVNMDVPIVMGIIALFVFSLYEGFQGRDGYYDSLGGLIFFLLIGRMYQQKTFDSLSFDRDYTAYFPLAVTRMVQEREEVISLPKLQVGDTIRIRKGELIPADGILLQGDAQIDYSFVTGEEVPISVAKGELIYAGGRQQSGALLLCVQKEPSQGYLTDLWNHESFRQPKPAGLESLANRISGKFTIAVVAIALMALAYWSMKDWSLAVRAFASVLIVACPCALAMSTPFTLGNALRIMGHRKFYLKNGQVVEQLANVDAYVFDKTGTLTDPSTSQLVFVGEELTPLTKQAIKAMVSQSSHPLSRRINLWLEDTAYGHVEEFEEHVGLGLEGMFEGKPVRLGAATWLGLDAGKSEHEGSLAYLSYDGKVLGYFYLTSTLRKGVEETVALLNAKGEVHLLSGDRSTDEKKLKQVLGESVTMVFDQSPKEKLGYLKNLNEQGNSTLMVGDGLNDAGALKESSVGIAVIDQATYFSPASDAIMDVEVLRELPAFILLAKDSRKVIVASFVLSLLYNVIGVGLAVQGLLSPVICAILMPLSSISVVVFTTVAMNCFAYKRGLKNSWIWK